MLQQGKKLVAAGVVGAAAAASTNQAAECKSITLTPEQCEEAAGSIKDELSKSKDGLVLSRDGTPWIMPRPPAAAASHDFELLELATTLAADPIVQARLSKIELKAEAQRSLESWPTTRSSSPVSFSALLDSADQVDQMEHENARLKAENEMLQRENRRLSGGAKENSKEKGVEGQVLEAEEPAPPEPAAPRLPAADESTAEAEAKVKEEAPVTSLLPRAPTLAAVLRLSPAMRPVRLQLLVEADGKLRVELLPQPQPEEGEAGEQKAERPTKTRQQKERTRQAVIVATAIVVGLLAVTLTKNPAATKAAVASAAAAVSGLMLHYQSAQAMPR